MSWSAHPEGRGGACACAHEMAYVCPPRAQLVRQHVDPFSILEGCCGMLWEGPEPQVTLGGEIPVRNGRMPNPLARTQLGDNLQHKEQESLRACGRMGPSQEG